MLSKLVPVFAFLIWAMALSAQQPAATIDFGKQVQPILTENCVGCHKGTSAPAGLRLDTAAGVLKGSGSGAVVLPENSKQSVLAQRIWDTGGNQMPPGGPLPKVQIQIIVDWIDQGAKADVTPAELAPTSATPARRSVAPPNVTSVTTAAQERAMFDYYCVTCHPIAGGLALDKLDPANVQKDAEIWEKVVRKLRAGMMPPAGMPRPSAAAYESMITYLEGALDRHATVHLPSPGIHRLNRTEYANAIQDLLALEIDPSKFLPSDDSTRGFDNIAGALAISPALLEGYTSAAEKISRLAVGDVTEATLTTYRVPSDTSQDYHIEGLPFATRGGLIVKHVFPADGDYVFKIFPINQGLMDNNRAFGEIRGEKLELLIDGERVHLYDWDRELATGPAVHGGTQDVRVPIKGGLHTVGVTFLATQLAPSSDLNEHFMRSTIETGGLPGFKFLPHVGKVEILGPEKPAGAIQSGSRGKIFVCQPAAGQETACAQRIVSALARSGFRRPVTAEDTETLMSFYQQGLNEDGKFDTGIERALERVLADPEFVFRKETELANVKPNGSYRISDLELASRLSFFLWSSIPDNQLIDLAAQNKLHDPAVLEQQVRRMLADPRSDRLVANFAGQWLNLRSVQTWFPIPGLFPDWDDNLRSAMRTETELFVGSIVHEDRSVIDFIDANYTFLNERLAAHYGIPNIYGSRFRRVEFPAELNMRRGLLGQGSIETISAYPNRTSPTVRGKTMMQIFLGVSPPDPPPNVPALKEKDSAVHALTKPTMRQQMEMHRKNEPCATCHKIMDPIGFSLENFDPIGKWRVTDDGSPINPVGQLVDGSPINGVAGLREILLRYKPQFVRVIAEKLMIYALGRGTEYYDMPVIRSIVRDAERNNYRFSSLVLGVVRSEPFQMNQKIQTSGTVQPGQVVAAR
jgi:mono/diheme cytochrome c family protein